METANGEQSESILSTETINDAAQRGAQSPVDSDVSMRILTGSPAASDVSMRTLPRSPAASDVTMRTQSSTGGVVAVQRQGLLTEKQFIFPPGHSEKQVIMVLEYLRTLEKLTVSVPPDSTGRWLRLLPPSLRTLYVNGPGETGGPLTSPEAMSYHGLEVVIQQAGDDVIDQLAKELGPQVNKLTMFNCPRVTAGALQRLISALTGLEDVTLDGSLSGAITDASLAALCLSTETINDAAQRGAQSPVDSDVSMRILTGSPAASDVSMRTLPRSPAASDVTMRTQSSTGGVVAVQRQGLLTEKQFIFPPGHSEKQVIMVLEYLRTLEKLTVSVPPDSTGRWLRLLPPSLRTLYVNGPGETGGPLTSPEAMSYHGLEVVIQQAGDDVIDQLAKELGPQTARVSLLGPCSD
ncbi:uncharacterized protein LOC122389497 isoform X2 [Amphibalanus amphitrite]|uniref:uncharacterized protein LOC122389497 isoform X2 n=1 Tax=Amphibalanus amphitrite TaxID=1232801 RepID=UPI001C90514C|nr:uncharacterized protein LOC122389497 isoform X2 [Amphibalanus amphitrite]